MPPLIRYFSENNAGAFVEEGEVLMRTLSYFRNYEDQGVRADQHEGSLVHHPAKGLIVTKTATGEEIALPHRLESTIKEGKIFIYCMSTELSLDIAQHFKAEVAVEIIEPFKF